MIPRGRGMFGRVLVGATALAAVFLAISQRPAPAGANHAWTHEQGSGYSFFPNVNWVNVYINPSYNNRVAEAQDAIENWRSLRYDNFWWFFNTSYAPDACGDRGPDLNPAQFVT